MAELQQVQHYQTDTQPVVDQVAQTEPVLTYPSKRSRQISFFEKVVTGAVILCMLGLALMTVKYTTTINQTEKEIMVIQSDIAVKTEKLNKLEQEKRELSSADRIKKAAEAAGMTIQDDNIRNVKK